MINIFYNTMLIQDENQEDYEKNKMLYFNKNHQVYILTIYI